MEKLARVTKEWGGKAKRLVIAGDYLNGNQISSHPKLIIESFQEELAIGREVLEELAKNFEEVIIMDDNHIHSRWLRHISKALTPDLHFLLTHPYDYLVKGLPNVKRASATSSFQYAEDIGWFYQQGDAVFTHAELSSAVEFRTARKAQEYLKKWAPVFGLGSIKFVAQAHNHKLGIYHDYDSAVAYTGCMLSMEAVRYSMAATAVGSPPIAGYLILVQENGVTDLVETRVVRMK